jgi:hypothetical protein
MKNTNVVKGRLLPNEVDVRLDVLGAPMMNRVGGEVDHRDIITVDQGGIGDGNRELAKKLSELGDLGDSVGDGAVLCFGAGAGDRGLSLRRP